MLTNPNTLGPVRPQHRGDRADRPRRGGDALLRRREPERRDGHRAARATWASTSCTSTCTRRSRSRTAAAARARARSPCSDRIEPFLPRPQVVRRAAQRRRAASTSTTTGPSRSASCAASRATSACSCAPTPTSARSAATGSRTCREIAVLNANYLKALLAEEGIAEYLPIAFDRTCMHEFVLSGARREGEARHQDARHRQAAARPRRAPADGLLPAARGRGADDRADRDRDEGAPRPLRRRGPRDPRGGEGGPGDRPQRALHDAGAPPRRGRRGQAPRGALAPGERTPASRSAQSRPHGACSCAVPSGTARRARASPRRSCGLAARNHGLPLEALRHEITPPGLHYLLIHYDIPAVDPAAFRLEVGGAVERPLSLSLDELRGSERAPLSRSPSSARATAARCSSRGRSASPG